MDPVSAPPTTENTFVLTEPPTRSPSPDPIQAKIRAALNGGIRREAAYIFRFAEDGHNVVAEGFPSIAMMDIMLGSKASVLKAPTEPPSPFRTHNLHPLCGIRGHFDARNLAAALSAVRDNQESRKVDADAATDPEANTGPPTRSTTPGLTNDDQPAAIDALSNDDPKIPAPSAEVVHVTEGATETNPPAVSTPVPTSTPLADIAHVPTLKRKRSARSIGETRPNNKRRTKLTAEKVDKSVLPQRPKKKTHDGTGKPGATTKTARAVLKAQAAVPSSPPPVARVRPTSSARAQKVAHAVVTAPSKVKGAPKEGGRKLDKSKAKVTRKA